MSAVTPGSTMRMETAGSRSEKAVLPQDPTAKIEAPRPAKSRSTPTMIPISRLKTSPSLAIRGSSGSSPALIA